MNKVNYLRLKKRLIKNSQFNLELEHNLSTFGQTINLGMLSMDLLYIQPMFTEILKILTHWLE